MKTPSLPKDPGADDPSLSTTDEASLGRALIYRFLATGYRYPEAESIGTLCEQGHGIPEALAAVGDSAADDLSEQLSRLQDTASQDTASQDTASQDTAPDGTMDDLATEYVAMFGHAVRGACPLYEAEYGESDERLQQPHELSDLSAFYQAFGLELSADVRDRVDFIAVECEFMAFLCLKQAYAEEHNKADLAAIAVDAQRKFLHDHLGRWAPAFARRVLERTDHALYRPLAQLTLTFVIDDCRRLDVAPGDENLRLRLPLKEADACQTCPMAKEGSQPELPRTTSNDAFAEKELGI